MNIDAFADGEAGKISVGKSNISVYVPSMLKVNGLKENTIVIGNDGKNGVKEIPLCVYSNDLYGTINVTTVNNGDKVPFVLSNGESTAGYKLLLKSPDRRERYFSPNSLRHSIDGVSSKSDSCDGENNAALRFEIDQSVINSNSGKPFRGALTVMLEPS